MDGCKGQILLITTASNAGYMASRPRQVEPELWRIKYRGAGALEQSDIPAGHGAAERRLRDTVGTGPRIKQGNAC